MSEDARTILALKQAPEKLDGLIERWWADHFPGSAVARDTAAWNVAHTAKETLKHMLGSTYGSPPTNVDRDWQRSI
jgi:hypothetical protein